MPRDLLSVRCPRCGFRFKVERKYGGRATRCPQAECAQKLRLPEAIETKPRKRADVEPSQTRLASSTRQRAGTLRRRTGTSSAAKKSQPLGRRFIGQQRWLAGIGIGSLIMAVAFFMFAPGPEASPIASSVGVQVVAADEPPPPDVFREEMLPFVEKFCSDCH
ncbi:MAG: hypothetical protein ACYTGL_28160, partial [Planctomycetota bacterium]